MEAVNWVCDDALDDHVWVDEQTISCQEAKVLEASDFDIEVPCVVQWSTLWFSSPTNLNWRFLDGGTIIENYNEVINLAVVATFSLAFREMLTPRICFFFFEIRCVLYCADHREMRRWGLAEWPVLLPYDGDSEDDLCDEKMEKISEMDGTFCLKRHDESRHFGSRSSSCFLFTCLLVVNGVERVLSRFCFDGSEWRGWREVLVCWCSSRSAERSVRTEGALVGTAMGSWQEPGGDGRDAHAFDLTDTLLSGSVKYKATAESELAEFSRQFSEARPLGFTTDSELAESFRKSSVDIGEARPPGFMTEFEPAESCGKFTVKLVKFGLLRKQNTSWSRLWTCLVHSSTRTLWTCPVRSITKIWLR